MPMSRYQIRNEYSLADPELYGVADKDDPEALLEAVAMAGLVGVLRQLGDLTEFAAEVFHDLHEEVMATATRGHGLMVRVKQLETEFPPIEKAFLSQTSPSAFFSNTGTAWHPSLHMNQNLITGGDLPRFIMDSYEECRGPPRLFLLDKFDVAGAGACLKRYTDPSFFKVEASSYGLSSAEVQKEKRYRKSKQKKGSRLRNAGTPEVLPGSHAKLQQLFLEDRVENGLTDSARLVKLKRRLNGYPFDSKSGKSFMEIFINTSSPEDKVVHEVAYGPSPQELQPKTTSESGAAASSLRESMSIERTAIEPFNYMDEVSEDLRDRELSLGTNQYPLEVAVEKEIAVDGESKPDGNEDGYQSDDVASEVDNYMDALATMESEIDTETEFRTKYNIGVVGMEKHGTDHDANEKLLHVQFPDSQSTGNSDTSEDGNISDKKESSHLSYSDTGSTAAENMPDDVTAEVSLTTRVCEAEVSVKSTEKVLMSEKRSFSQDYEPPNHDFSDDISNEVDDVPSYAFESGLPCSSLPHSDSFPTHITPDGVAKGTLSGPQMVKILSNHDELDAEFIKTEEYSRTRGNNIPWTSRHSRVPSQTKDDEPLADKAFAENCILDKLDGDPSVLSNASIHISDDIFEVIPKKYDYESSVDDSLESECEEGSHTENFDENQISTLHSVISHAEVEPSVPAVLDSETTNTVLEPEVVNSVDNVCPSPRVITVDSNFASDGYKNSSIVEQQGSEWADDIPSIPISAAVDACHEEEAPNRVLCEADSGEMGETTHNISLIGSETTAVTKTFNFVDSGAPESFVGSPVSNKVDNVKVSDIASRMAGTDATALTNLDVPKTTGRGSLIDEKQNEEDQADNITVAGIAANCDSDADNVESTSQRNVTAEDTHFSQKPDQHGSEDFAELLPQNCNESVEKPPLVNQDNTSPDLDSVRYETDFGDHSDFKMVSYIPESNLQPVKDNVLSSSSIPSNQNTELVSSKESNFRKHSGDILLSSTHHLPETRTHSESMLTLQTDKVDLEHLHVDESKPKEIFPSEQLLCLDHLDDRSSDAYSEPYFVASKGIVQLNKQANSLAVEPSHGDNASLLDKNHTDIGENIFTSPRSSSVPSPSELSQPGSDEVDISAQARDELSAVHSGLPLLPEVPQVDLPQMPPLPPLPPVQWRIGRAHQHASLPSERDLVQNNFGMFPPMFPAKTSNNAQKGYETNMDDLLPLMPILPRPALKDEDHLHDNEHFRGTAAHSGPLPVQMPLTSIVTSKNVPISDDTCNTDPCVTLSSTVNDGSSQDVHVEVAETMQSSCTPSSTIETTIDASNLSGSVPSPLSQMQPDSCSEPESTSVRSEIRLIKFLDTNVAQPTVADEHPKDVSTNVEGENVWSTSNSSNPAPEDGKLNGNRQLKLPRPRSPLIDAVAAHDKSMLKKVAERSRPDVQKVEERDSLLEQIRAKSFNLKPAVVTRPSIQGPKTNLRVAAILEKANAIRQAFAGSDDDEDDDDSWSDS